MIQALFNQPSYLAAKQLLDVTAKRMEAISSNLANVETPDYKRIDVSPAFEGELQRAIRRGDTAALQTLKPELTVDRSATARRTDGNTVDLEQEMVHLYRTSFEHTLETQVVSGSLQRMRLAITGRNA